MRTCLAAAIFAKPDVLMLDEPTNHLSIGAVLWLMRELTTSPAWSERIVVVVSHDRVFLDAVATDVLHLSAAARRLTQSHGNYATWAKRREQQQKTFERATALRAEQAPPHTPPRPAPAPRPALTAPLPCRARPPAASFPRASGRQAQDVRQPRLQVRRLRRLAPEDEGAAGKEAQLTQVVVDSVLE